MEELELAVKPTGEERDRPVKGGSSKKPDAAPAPTPDPTPDATPEPTPEPTPDAAAEPEPEPSAPDGTESAVVASSGERVVFTKGAHTVRFDGPVRTFTESKHGITNTVVTTSWVRLLARPFDGRVDADDSAWLEARVIDNTTNVADVLAMAYQYIDGSPDLYAGPLRIAGDAGYGSDSGADFNDFLKIDWSYPSENRYDRWDPVHAGNLDCSGFTRIVYGYRGGIPLSWNPLDGTTLPRRAMHQLSGGAGVVTIPHVPYKTVAAADLAKLQPGDLVFFDASSNDDVIDHMGIFLGVDTSGNHRMINSRNSMYGPTMRDGAGSAYGESGQPSIVNGTSLYGRTFRAARRL